MIHDVQSHLENMPLTPMQRVSYGIQLSWLVNPTIPQVEVITLSKGLIAPANGTSYLSMLTGIQVFILIQSHYQAHNAIPYIAPIQSRFSRGLPSISLLLWRTYDVVLTAYQ